MAALRRLFPDPFVPILLGVLAFASIVPVRGGGIVWAEAAATLAVVLLFFLNGVRLPLREVLDGIRNVRLQGAIFAVCFGAFPLVGLAAGLALGGVLPPLLATGFLFLGVLPSTVQSATVASTMAEGNVAAAIVAAALLNLAGIALSPLLFALVAGAKGVALSGDLALRIVSMLLLPFVAGQLAQRWLRPWVLRHRQLATLLDRVAIATAVYVAFSAAVVAGVWATLAGGEVAIVLAAAALLLALAHGSTWALGARLRLSPPDRATLMFSASQKSIAVGAPLATLLFAGAAAGIVLLPVLAYHIGQLVLAAWLAPRLAARRGLPSGPGHPIPYGSRKTAADVGD